MKELNVETIEAINRVLNILKDFSIIDGDAEIDIRQLALGLYENDIDEWVVDLVESLFVNGIEFISDEFIEDAEYIYQLIEKYDKGVASYYYNEFLASCGYDNCEDERSLNKYEYEQYFNKYYTDLSIKEIELYSPLIKGNDGIYKKFLSHVPALVERYLGLYSHVLIGISAKFDKKENRNIIVMHVMYDYCSSFSEEFYPKEMLEDFEILLKQILKDSR